MGTALLTIGWMLLVLSGCFTVGYMIRDSCKDES